MEYSKRTKGVDPGKLTGKEAEEFADNLVKGIMKDEYAAGFIAMIKEGRGTTKELNALRSAFLKSQGKAGWLKEFRMGKALPVIGTMASLYFVATSADANEAIANLLPPGADLAWSYAGSSSDRAYSGAGSIGKGAATASELNSDIPVIRGVSQDRATLRDLLGDDVGNQ